MLNNLPSLNVFRSPDDGLPTMGSEKLEDPIIPATPDNMCCLDGCKHYCDCLEDSEDLGAGKELKRYCAFFGNNGGPAELSEDAIYACSAFRPPWWSVKGQKRRAQCMKRLKTARIKIAERSQEAADREAGRLTLEQETREL